METPQPAWIIKSAKDEGEVEQVYTFAKTVLGDFPRSMEYYLKAWRQAPSLQVYAEIDGQVAGCCMGSIDDDHVLVGEVAVAESARRMGIGAAMLRRLEQEAAQLGQATLILGARQVAEPFYLSAGFRPNLFIQVPCAGRLDDLKRINPGYPAVWEEDKGGWTRLMLALTRIDRALQTAYEKEFPGCATQTVFIKEIISSRYAIR